MLLRSVMPTATKKFPISALPLPPTSRILTNSLTPDPSTSAAPHDFRAVLKDKPSIQRRSRVIDANAHFSRVTPLPIEFPYRIAPPEDGRVVEDKEAYVEDWLAAHEPLEERQLAPTPSPGVLKKYSCVKRDGIERVLIGLSDTCLKDCFPSLAVGDAFVEIGDPTLSMKDPGGNDISDMPKRKVLGDQVAHRQELVDVLSGHSVLMHIENSEDASSPGYTPWSLRYSGHQFGTWAGQLGDGRAVSILETPHPKTPAVVYELQLKGAGRTPFSRSADGLAVLRSSIREYLCAEAMHALHIPTTRSLALIHLPELEVLREEAETGCVLTRVAPSFLRIGSFEALNTPQRMFFFGGGQQDPDLDALRVLGEWISTNVLRLGLNPDEKWGKKLVMEVARRNAKMVAGWQAHGFMHGVINTDNVSILGLTIDYGPYAFMDVYDSMHICNHSDGEGRYAYKYQPTMIVYALKALLRALSPLIGAEEESGRAVKSSWSAEAAPEKIETWSKKGMEVEDEMVTELQSVFEKEHWNLFRKRLGLTREDPTDPDGIVRPLLATMERHKLDFHTTFRRLCFFTPSLLTGDSDALSSFIQSFNFEGDRGETAKAWLEWLDTYAARVQSEISSSSGEDPDAFEKKRVKAMKRANPRFVLRQWVLEEIIKRVEDDPETGKRALAKVHEMATKPYEPWGAEGDSRADNELTPEESEERRFCGMGAKSMLGFQCSCSS